MKEGNGCPGKNSSVGWFGLMVLQNQETDVYSGLPVIEEHGIEV